MLVDSVCDLIKGDVPDELVQKCESELSLEVLERGLVIGMNFFQRSVLDAIYSEAEGTLMKEDFRSVEFQNIDYSIFFMFKIYQATQARIFISLDQALQGNSTFDYVLFSLQILVFALVVGFAWQFVKREKQNLSNLAGEVLVVPLPVIRATNGLMKKITEHFEFDYD